MSGISQNGQKRLIFVVFPKVRTKLNEKGKREKKQTNMRMNKPKENTLIYMQMYIYTPTDILAYIDRNTHIHVKSDSAF